MDDIINNFAAKALYITFIISLLPVGVATTVGLTVAILQTLTQIQEQTLPFFFKMVSIFSALYLMSSWASSVILEFTKSVYVAMQ